MIIGELVPYVPLPRFTSFIGPGTYDTEPFLVEDYFSGMVTFWRGPLVGGAASNPFRAMIQVSHDKVTWTTVVGEITDADDVENYVVIMVKRWIRVRIILAAEPDGVVAISVWMAGALQRRVKSD